MSSASAEPNTPAKAGIKRTLEFPSPSPLKSPTSSTKEPIYGYVLYVTELLRGAYGQYFHVQFQTNAGTFSINAYETNKHKQFFTAFERAIRTCINVKRSNSDGSFYFAKDCFIREATQLEVPFDINDTLRSTLVEGAKSKESTIKDILRIDPFTNRTLFTLVAKVFQGDAALGTIPTSRGDANVKNDIIAEDASGYIRSENLQK